MKVCPDFVSSIKSQGNFLRHNIVYYLRDKGKQCAIEEQIPKEQAPVARRQKDPEAQAQAPRPKNTEKHTEPKEPRLSKDLKWLSVKIGDVEITYEKYKKFLVSVLGNKKIKKLSKKYQQYNLVHEPIELTQEDLDNVAEIFKD